MGKESAWEIGESEEEHSHLLFILIDKIDFIKDTKQELK
jgi:hypothetical protein